MYMYMCIRINTHDFNAVSGRVALSTECRGCFRLAISSELRACTCLARTYIQYMKMVYSTRNID